MLLRQPLTISVHEEKELQFVLIIRDFYPECSTEIRDRKLTWAEGDFSQYEIQLNA